MTGSVKSHIEKVLSLKYDSSFFINNITSVSGGSINDAYKIETGTMCFFAKLNEAGAFPGMYEAEIKGLELLEKNSGIKIPKPVVADTIDKKCILILEYIEPGIKNIESFEHFGYLLAEMHRKSNDRFGLDHDNYIGLLKQSNNFHSGWTEFFIEERLSKQLQMAYDQKKISRTLLSLFDRLYAKLHNLFPVGKPALLHGDLWSGNYMVTKEGRPCIFDPAVYYGHREMDLAMTKLFGGFPEEFYRAYLEYFPLEKGWKERMDLCNLYPLLVHVNLFGGGYTGEVEMIVKRFA